MSMSIDISWPAPAKLNLFLHITGRREDGYHLLQTVFQFLDHGDQLSFQINNNGEISRSNPIAGVNEEDDLTVRAAKLLRQTAQQPKLGATITIEKNLPMGGGLGGGSSDAATTLVALNQLWELELSTEQLAELGVQLGADIPIFVHGHAAWAEGVGEKITPIKLPEPWFLTIIPPVHVSTAEIFGSSQLTRDCQAIKIPGFLAGEGRNVCEPVVCQHYPEVQEALDWLSQFAEARMTGTGACVFAAFDDRSQAEAALQALPTGWQGFVAKGLNQSPLLKRAQTTAS